MDLSKFSDADLAALKAGDISKVSDAGLAYLKNAMSQEKGPPSILDTVTKYSAGSGLANLADMIPNALVNVANLGIAGYGATKGAITGSSDLPELIPHDALSGWSKMAKGEVPVPTGIDLAKAAYGVGKRTLTGSADLPNAGSITTPVKLINDEYRPTTTAGKIADFTTQSLTGGGVNPAAVVRNASRGQFLPVVRDVLAAGASGAGAGAGHTLASNVKTGNDSIDNALMATATLFGGLVPGGIVAARGTAGDRAAAATQGITPQQFQAARELMTRAHQSGSSITAYEALQQITGLNPKMQTQQRLAEQSDAAQRSGLTQMMQNRPQANAQLFDRVADSIAPNQALPDTLAGRLQTAATGAIDSARREGNARAQPYYDSAQSQRIPSQTWNALVQDPAIVAALEAVRRDPYLRLGNETAGSMRWMDAAKKHLDAMADPGVMAGPLDRTRSSAATSGSTNIRNAVDQVIPDYARGRQIVEENMRNVVEPLRQSQVGKLSQSNDFKSQSESFLPNAPADVNPSVIQRTAQVIGKQDPNIIPQFLAQDLRRKFNEANQQNMTGENVFGGSKFAANVAGNQAQEANLIAALRASNADDAALRNALDIFRAQGMKPSVNSATAANLSEQAAISTRLPDFLMRGWTSTKGAIDGYRNSWATKALADALADPTAGVRRIEELARINGVHDPIKQQILINMLLADQAASSPESSATR